MSDEHVATYFFDEEGNSLSSQPGILPIPLFKGMEITIHGHQGAYEVVNWTYHIGQPDEGAGLTITLKLSDSKPKVRRRPTSREY